MAQISTQFNYGFVGPILARRDFLCTFSNMRHDQRVTVQKMTDDNLQLSFNIIELNANFYRYQFYLNVIVGLCTYAYIS